MAPQAIGTTGVSCLGSARTSWSHPWWTDPQPVSRVVLLIFGVNSIGDALRDFFDRNPLWRPWRNADIAVETDCTSPGVLRSPKAALSGGVDGQKVGRPGAPPVHVGLSDEPKNQVFT